MAVEFRAALRADARYVLGLEEACMRAYAEALWGHWHPSDNAATLCLIGCRIIGYGGVAVGCVQVTNRGDHLWLEKLYIDPDHQNRGLGALVLRHVLNAAAHEQLPVKLCVLATNPAQAFYRRAGFVVCEELAERRIMMMPAFAVSPAAPQSLPVARA